MKGMDMYIATQFSIFMVNKPGVLANVLEEFAQAKVNIVAMTMMDSAEHGVMRVIFGAPLKAKKLLKKLNMAYNETEVLCVNIANKSGEFAKIIGKLSQNHINISYAYCTAGAKGGRTTGVLKVADVKKAMKKLGPANQKTAKSNAQVRRSHGLRN